MDREIVTPNLHVALVHFPIALLIVGSAIELFSFFWRRHSFRSAGRWMILLGALLAVPTVFSGIYAYADVARHNIPDQFAPWREVKSNSPLSEQQWHFLWDHTWKQILATSLALVAVLTWIASSDGFRRKLQLPLLIVLLLGDLFMLSGAWHGGELVYRYGTAVEIAKTPAPEKEDHLVTVPSTMPTTTAAATMPTTGPTTKVFELPLAATTQPEQDKVELTLVQAVFPPVQTHVIFAGLTIAMALVALSLSIRSWTSSDFETQETSIVDASLPSEPGAPVPTADLAAAILTRPRVPSTRFWFLALLVAGITAFLGDWILASGAETWKIQTLIDLVRNSTRLISHGVLGVSIIVLLLILGIISRWAPRQKMLITIFAGLLLLAVALQIRAGILLLYDGSDGPVMKFQ